MLDFPSRRLKKQYFSINLAFVFSTRIAILTLEFLAWQPGFAQNTHEGFEHLTLEQGLPSTMVTDILFDKTGYLWAATGKGLSPYDGYNSVTYKFDPRDSHRRTVLSDLPFAAEEKFEGLLPHHTAVARYGAHSRIDMPPGALPQKFGHLSFFSLPLKIRRSTDRAFFFHTVF